MLLSVGILRFNVVVGLVPLRVCIWLAYERRKTLDDWAHNIDLQSQRTVSTNNSRSSVVLCMESYAASFSASQLEASFFLLDTELLSAPGSMPRSISTLRRCPRCSIRIPDAMSHCLPCSSSRCESCGVFVAEGSCCCVSGVACSNCRRTSDNGNEYYSVAVAEYPVTANMRLAVSFHYKFCLLGSIADSDTSIHLCEGCHEYLNEGKADNAVGRVWFIFVWTVLRRSDLFEKAWVLVPATWRVWWRAEVARVHSIALPLLDAIPVSFFDVTDDYVKDIEAVNVLEWRGLMDRERSLVLPEVRCPAGCSEYKHKANELPFDIVWEELLGRDLSPLVSEKEERSFTRFFRKDYLQVEHIASNPEWPCKPSIVMLQEKGAPFVLCCRNHSRLHRRQMIHTGRNETGSTSSPHAGGLSPVVPVPRTIQKSRMSSYAASFHMAQMEGSFFGTDTMFLSASRGMGSTNSHLAWRQDVQTYAGRNDVRAYTRAKYASGWGNDGHIATAIDREATRVLPYLSELKAALFKGASYVALSDAVGMQTHIDFGASEAGESLNEQGVRQERQYQGHYPKRLVWAHPGMSKSGCRPPVLPNFGYRTASDGRIAWILSSLMLLVPEVWESVAAIPNKKQWNWEGHLLTYLTAKCLPHVTPASSSGTLFGKAGPTEEELINEYLAPGDSVTGTFSTRHLETLFAPGASRMSNVAIERHSFPVSVPADVSIVLVTREYCLDAASDLRWNPPMKLSQHGRRWKLCYLAETALDQSSNEPNHWSGTVYSRYSSDETRHWWKAQRRKDLPVECGTSFVRTAAMLWDVCVYVAHDASVTAAMRDQILASCGGQNKVYCRAHNYPLISSPKTDERTCYCRVGQLPLLHPADDIPDNRSARCGLKSIFACTVPTCLASICRRHQAGVAEWSGKFFVGTECSYGPAVAGATNFTAEEQRVNLAMPFNDSQREERVPVGDDNEMPVLDFDAGFDRDEEIDRMVELTGGGDDDDAGDERLEAHFRLLENLDNEVFIAAATQGLDDMEDIEARDEADLEVQRELLDPTVPTTNAGVLPVYSIPEGDYEDACVNNHVVLNTFGHMLMRRNKKIAGTMNQRHFLQRMVSRVPGDSLSLVYPEGMLFGDIFNYDTINGTIVGAIPSALLNSGGVLESLGFTSLEDHYRTRLSNPGILCSSNPKYHLFAYDCLTNLGLRGCDSRIILRRGFAELQKDGGVSFKGRDEPIFDTEQVDCSAIVNKLAAAVNQSNPTYFYTHTCSMRTHFGMKVRLCIAHRRR